ncbi:hypothetical protein HUJ05_010472 [Dendroctonus ponderosae]|nr:hypothetical protein HUJ05_010472 [Dendroctonus ponderosae]
MTVYLQLILFSSFVGLVWLIKASPVVRYYLKFSAYYGIVMVGSLFLIPVFIFHPFSVHNFVIGSHCFRWITHLIGVKWIIQNPDYLESDEPCIIVSNHQSSLDVLGLFQIWPKMGKCTVIARNAVFWVWPMGFAAWLAGLIFIPRAKSKADRAKTIINDVADQLTLTQSVKEHNTSRMAHFKRLNTKIYEAKGPDVTPDFIYWKQLTQPVLVKEFGPIDHIDFSPKEPHHFAVTCSVRVQIYNPITKLVTKNLSRFRENAYGAVFRSDGTLIVAGGEEKNIKIFDVSTKSMLRLFKGHSAPVHRVAFVNREPQIVSFSDDKSVKVWDIPTENTLHTFEGHNDYIRAGQVSPDVPNIVLSGSYDSIIKMWDTRTAKEVMTMDHKSPVESLLFMPNGGMFLSSGGTDIKIWDVLAGGKLRGALAQHHKTVTCLKLGSGGKRLLSGSLDRHVKIYDVSTFKVVHTLDFPNAILSLGIAPDDSTVVAGLSDGVIAVQRRSEETTSEKRPKKVAFNYKFHDILSNVDEIVPDLQNEKEAKYDYYFRKFEYAKALKAALMPYVVNKHPERTVAVLRELQKRKGLPKVLKYKDSNLPNWLTTIKQLVRFFISHITDQRFTRFLVSIADEFIDIIADRVDALPSDIGLLLVQLYEVLNRENNLAMELAMVEGMMQTLLYAQVTAETDNEINYKLVKTGENNAISAK